MVFLLFMTIGALGKILSATFQAGWTWFQSSYVPVAVLVLSELAFAILWFKIFLKPGKPNKRRCLDQY